MTFGQSVDRFEGADRVERVITTGGRSIECAFVVLGVGTEPEAGLIESARPDLGGDGGLAVDASLETATPGVFAVGDVASHDHPVFGRIRVEHYDNAWKMGEAAARNVLGEQLVGPALLRVPAGAGEGARRRQHELAARRPAVLRADPNTGPGRRTVGGRSRRRPSHLIPARDGA